MGAMDYSGEGSSTNLDNASKAQYLNYSASEIEILNKKARDILFESEQDSYDPYDDFHILTVQFGFTVMFSILWPLMPFACYIINAMKLRADSYRLCRTLKRPFPKQANGIGDWRSVFYAFAFIAILINILFICISTGGLEFFLDICITDISQRLKKSDQTLDDFILGPDFACLHFTWRLVIIIVLEHVCMLVAISILTLVPGVPDWIQNKADMREKKFKQVLMNNTEVLNLGETMVHTPHSSTSVQYKDKPVTKGKTEKKKRKDSPNKTKLRALETEKVQNSKKSKALNTANSKERLVNKWGEDDAV